MSDKTFRIGLFSPESLFDTCLCLQPEYKRNIPNLHPVLLSFSITRVPIADRNQAVIGYARIHAFLKARKSIFAISSEYCLATSCQDPLRAILWIAISAADHSSHAAHNTGSFAQYSWRQQDWINQRLAQTIFLSTISKISFPYDAHLVQEIPSRHKMLILVN